MIRENREPGFEPPAIQCRGGEVSAVLDACGDLFRPRRRGRALLIQGARAYVHKLKQPRSSKDHWLAALIQRGGHGKAAVALANKNVRTAWAMLTQGTDYHRAPVAA